MLNKKMTKSQKLAWSCFTFIFAIFFMSGCASNWVTTTLDPSTDMASIKSLHVERLAPDQRRIDLMIAKKLKEMGFEVNAEGNILTNIDAVVTYRDRWAWDMGNYMVGLTIIISDPETDISLARGFSYHSSLSRKSPEEMVDETLMNIFPHGK